MALLVTQPGRGVIKDLGSNSGFSYGVTGFTGTTVATYCLADQAKPDTCLTNTANITITVVPAPHLSDDAYTTTVDTPLNVPAPGVRTNDDPIPAGTEVRATPAAHGGAMLATSGLLYYVPDSG